MLRIFKTTRELVEAVKLIPSLPNFLSLRAAVKLSVTGRLPGIPIELGAYPWPNVKCWIMLMRNTLVEPYVSICLTNGGDINDAEDCFKRANSSLAGIDELYLHNIDLRVSKHLQRVMSKQYIFDDEDDICTTFYMSQETKKEISERKILLPTGYRFCELEPDTDASLVSKTWKYARYDDIHFTRYKLTHLPSVGVKCGDQLVSFEMICPSGALNHQYTLPEYRGKGLGSAVELKLCQKLTALDIEPFKYVGVKNASVIEMSRKCGYWRQITEHESKLTAVAYDFRMLKKRPEGQAADAA